MTRGLTPRAPPESNLPAGLAHVAAVVAGSREEQEGLRDDLLLEEQSQLKMSFEKFSPLQMMNVFTRASDLWWMEEVEEGIFSRPSDAKITLIYFSKHAVTIVTYFVTILWFWTLLMGLIVRFFCFFQCILHP